MDTTLFHNPACSKSRAALALLESRGVAVRVVDYLAAPPARATLSALAGLPGLEAHALLRADDVRADGMPIPDADDAVLDLLAAHPRYLQRPLFVHAGRGVIGRPPERVLDLLS